MATQRKRVFVAAGQVANAEHAHQGFELVGQGHSHAGQPARQRIAGKTGLVMVFNGIGHGFAQAIVERVVASHDALQLRELPHHVGHEIGLGQLGRLVGLGHQRLVAQTSRDGAGDAPHALHALALGAQLVVIHHLRQSVHPRSQRLLTVLVEKELGVGQARTHHALVATNDRAGVFGPDVADHQELVCQLARGVQQRKIFLIGLHREDQALLGHIEKLLLEGAHEHVGPLDQRGDLIEQRVILNGAHAAAHLGRCARQLAGDFSLAGIKRCDHRALALHRRGIAVSVREHDGRALGFEAMALGGVAGGQAQHLHGHDRAAVQGHQAMRRAHEMHAAPAGQRTIGFELVAHDLGNGQLGHGIFKGLLQPHVQRGAGDEAVIEQGFGLAVRRALERGHGSDRIGHVGAQSRELLEQGGRGQALSVQPHRHRHELLLHRAVFSLEPDMADVRGQATRRGVGGDARIGAGQALGLELIEQDLGKGITELFERLGRQLFNKQFNEKVLGGHGVCVSRVQAWRLRRPSASSVQPIHAGPSGSPAAHGFRNSFAPRHARGCGCGRCRRPARSPKSPHGHRAG